MNGSTADEATLVVFCRRPQAGVGKQRIAAAAGARFALDLSGHLLACVLEDAMAWPGAVALAPASPADAGWAAGLLGRAVQVVPQPAGNLGERIMAVDRELRAAGHQRLVFAGSDAPTMDASCLADARAALDGADVVLVPAEDGGVTLMGARRPWPPLAALPWSTPRLGEALEHSCRGGGFTVRILPAGYDVDEAATLPRLCRDLAADARPARQALRRWLLAEGLGAPATRPQPA